MSQSALPTRPVLPTRIVCKYLRTKMAFGSHADGAPDWQAGEDPTASYWCLRTMEAFGPDDSFAHAHGCRRGRDCFEKLDGDEDEESAQGIV